MPRANRHYIPGYVRHITHRRHKQEFLLSFEINRLRWTSLQEPQSPYSTLLGGKKGLPSPENAYYLDLCI